MYKIIIEKGLNNNDNLKAKERAAKLSKGIKQVKKLGIVVAPNAPIEGKMFW